MMRTHALAHTHSHTHTRTCTRARTNTPLPPNQPTLVFEGGSSYSSLCMHRGQLLDLFAFTNLTKRSPNSCTHDLECDGKAGVAISVVTL